MIPTYWMSIFKLPLWVSKSINKIRRDFLWSGPDAHWSKIRLVSWTRLCRPREQGGSGILNLQTFNNALLGKWWWRIMPDKGWCGKDIIRENYFKGIPTWNLFHKQRGQWSFFWNDILHSLPAFRKNLCLIIHNWAITLFWLDNWVDGCAPADIWPLLFQVSQYKEGTIREFANRTLEIPLADSPAIR